MLGGTNFVGPHLVRGAIDAGHEVTLFNRGITNPNLFPELEKLRGNRFPDRGEGLSALRGDRTWDAVLDTWQGAPGCVTATDRLLRDRSRQYLYISSIASYRHYRELGMTENSPILDASEYLDSFSEDIPYSDCKAGGERIVLGRPEGGTVLRCGSIYGPGTKPAAGESVDLGYWGYRFATGRDILAPKDPSAVFQFIDVRDLADFAAHAVDQRMDGPFNVVGPQSPISFPDYLKLWNRAVKDKAKLVWADRAFLDEHSIRPWQDLRNWIPGDSPEPGFYHISNELAVFRGLTFRPPQESLRDGLPANLQQVDLQVPAQGLSLEREAELINLLNNA